MVYKINIELLGETNMYFGLGLEIMTALILGGLIGFDREKKMKSAGIKTNMLICLGATLYTAISIINQQNAGGITDPNRIAAQIVSGIGFLGAGAIIHGQGRGNVTGLTTAATIWVVAAIGVTIGMGYPLVASLFTFTILVVLKLLGPVYKLFELQKDYKNFHIEILSKGPIKESIQELFVNENQGINQIMEEILDTKSDKRILHVYVFVHPRRIERLSEKLKLILRVDKVKFRNIDQPHDQEEGEGIEHI
jgi:putative Mg2+ transporter-C (MgtC) family protein